MTAPCECGWPLGPPRCAGGAAAWRAGFDPAHWLWMDTLSKGGTLQLSAGPASADLLFDTQLYFHFFLTPTAGTTQKTHTPTKHLGKSPNSLIADPQACKEKHTVWKDEVSVRTSGQTVGGGTSFFRLSICTRTRTHIRDRCSKSAARAAPSTRLTWWLHDSLQQAGERTQSGAPGWRWVVLLATSSAYKSPEPGCPALPLTGPTQSCGSVQTQSWASLQTLPPPAAAAAESGRCRQEIPAGRDLRLRLAALKGGTCRTWKMNAALTNTRGRQSRSVGNKDTKACFCH